MCDGIADVNFEKVCRLRVGVIECLLLWLQPTGGILRHGLVHLGVFQSFAYQRKGNQNGKESGEGGEDQGVVWGVCARLVPLDVNLLVSL